jgi:hypothetical protein
MLRFEAFRMVVVVLDGERLDLKQSKSSAVLLEDLIRLDVASSSRSTPRLLAYRLWADSRVDCLWTGHFGEITIRESTGLLALT